MGAPARPHRAARGTCDRAGAVAVHSAACGESSSRVSRWPWFSRPVRARRLPPPHDRQRRDARRGRRPLRRHAADRLPDDGLRALGRRRPRPAHAPVRPRDRAAAGQPEARARDDRPRLHPRRPARGRGAARRESRLQRAQRDRLGVAHALGAGRLRELPVRQLRRPDDGHAHRLQGRGRPAAVRLPRPADRDRDRARRQAASARRGSAGARRRSPGSPTTAASRRTSRTSASTSPTAPAASTRTRAATSARSTRTSTSCESTGSGAAGARSRWARGSTSPTTAP